MAATAVKVQPITSDVHFVGTYGLVEAAAYLRLPYSTVYQWTSPGTSHSAMIHPAEPNLLSFINLIELHVLKAMRKAYNLPLANIRTALDQARKACGCDHPLAEIPFETDGVDIFFSIGESYVNASRSGQLAMRGILETYLRRIQRNADGLPDGLFPFVTSEDIDEPRQILIAPHHSFGRPVIAGTGISTEVIYGRFNARDSMADLAAEYGLELSQVEEAIRWESHVQSAA